MTSAPLRIVIFRENRFWLAQALECDIGVQAEDLKDLLCRLELALIMEEPRLANLPPAPKYFQDLWPLKAGTLEPGMDFGRPLLLGMVA